MQLRWFFAACAAVITLLGTGRYASADLFISGTVTTHSEAAGGTGPESPVKRITPFGGGTVFTNFFSAGPPAASDRVISAGAFPIFGALVGTTAVPFNAGSDLVIVAALQGSVVGVLPTGATTDFDPGTGGFPSNVRIYDRSSVGAAFDSSDPSTWVPDTSNLATGLLAEFDLADRATLFPFYQKGAPGGTTTDLIPIVDPTVVNTATADPLEAFAIFDTELKLGLLDPGTFLDNFNVVIPPGFTFEEFGAQAILNESVQTDDDVPLNDLAALNAIVMALLGTGFTDGSLGGDYNPNPNVGSFDFPAQVSGGAAIPGAQVNREVVPEASSILVWVMVCAVGACLGVWRRRKQLAP